MRAATTSATSNRRTSQYTRWQSASSCMYSRRCARAATPFSSPAHWRASETDRIPHYTAQGVELRLLSEHRRLNLIALLMPEWNESYREEAPANLYATWADVCLAVTRASTTAERLCQQMHTFEARLSRCPEAHIQESCLSALGQSWGSS